MLNFHCDGFWRLFNVDKTAILGLYKLFIEGCLVSVMGNHSYIILLLDCCPPNYFWKEQAWIADDIRKGALEAGFKLCFSAIPSYRCYVPRCLTDLS